MVVDRIKYFEQKYWLSQAQAVLPNQVVLDVKKELQNAYAIHIMGKNQSLKYWAEQGYSSAVDFIDDLEKLGKPDLYDPVDIFSLINDALYFVAEIRDDPKLRIRTFRDRMISDPINKGKLNKKFDDFLNGQISKAETSIRYLSSILEKAAKKLQRAFPNIKSIPLHSGYSKQNRRRPSSREISNFITYHPESDTYSLNEPVLQELIMSKGLMQFPEKKERLITLMNAVKRGQTPQNVEDLVKEIEAIKATISAGNRPTTENMSEEEYQGAFKHEVQDPSQQWSTQMQNLKREKEEGRLEEEEAEREKQKLAPLIKQRDLEHEERQRQRQEEALTNKYNSLSLLFNVMNKMASKYHI